MVSAWMLLPAFMAGGMCGFFLMAFLCATRYAGGELELRAPKELE